MRVQQACGRARFAPEPPAAPRQILMSSCQSGNSVHHEKAPTLAAPFHFIAEGTEAQRHSPALSGWFGVLAWNAPDGRASLWKQGGAWGIQLKESSLSALCRCRGRPSLPLPKTVLNHLPSRLWVSSAGTKGGEGL